MNNIMITKSKFKKFMQLYLLLSIAIVKFLEKP